MDTMVNSTEPTSRVDFTPPPVDDNDDDLKTVRSQDNRPGVSSLDIAVGETLYQGVSNGSGAGFAESPMSAPAYRSPSSSANSSFRTPKRLSSNALANHLYHGRPAYSPNEGSRRSSFNSDVDGVSASDAEYHSELSELNQQITKIRQQLSNLEENQGHSDDQYVRVKQDNAILRERINQLEEQLQASEQMWKQRLDEAERRNREVLARITRERQLELEASVLRYKLLERDHECCSAQRHKLQSELDALREKFSSVSMQLEDAVDQLKSSDRQLADKSAECARLQDEERARLDEASETIEELRQQLEQLSREHDLCSSTFVDDPNDEIAQEVQRLREERQKLLATNDELHAELLQASLDHGKTLLQDGVSLADELSIEKMTTEQLMDALKEQETVNQKLRVYVEGILTRVIEMYPEILEIRLDKE